jgi:sugar phosphate permease
MCFLDLLQGLLWVGLCSTLLLIFLACSLLQATIYDIFIYIGLLHLLLWIIWGPQLSVGLKPAAWRACPEQAAGAAP